MPAIIELRDVTKIYASGASAALEHVSLEFRGRRGHRRHGSIRLRQVDAFEPDRRSRSPKPGSVAVVASQVDRMGESERPRSSVAPTSGSSSSSSTCSRTSRCATTSPSAG